MAATTGAGLSVGATVATPTIRSGAFFLTNATAQTWPIDRPPQPLAKAKTTPFPPYQLKTLANAPADDKPMHFELEHVSLPGGGSSCVIKLMSVSAEQQAKG